MKLILLIVLCTILLVISVKSREGFVDDKSAIYAKYIEFYNPFMTNWKTAIITSIGLDKPAPTEGAKAETPSSQEIKQYIQKLRNTTGKLYPDVSDILPDEMSSDFLDTIYNNPSIYISSFVNALNWMNEGLQKSMDELDTHIQGFEDMMCQQIIKCQQEHDTQQKAEQTQKIQEKLSVLEQIVNNKDLQNSFKTNTELMAKSKRIQLQAQSGALLNQIQFPKDKGITYTLPPGSNSLDEMQKNDPEKYKKYKDDYKQWFNLKQMFNGINSSLH